METRRHDVEVGASPDAGRAPEHALVVLGCVVRAAAAGDGGPGNGGPANGLAEGAARRRVVAAAEAWHREDGPARPSVVIVSGGRAWDGLVEADAMAQALVRLGVPEARIVRERLSHSTKDNARFVAAQCARRGIGRVAIVSCVWHLPRAVKLFEGEGLEVIEQVPAPDVPRSWAAWAWIRARERVLASLAPLPRRPARRVAPR